jgi:hypothetical protein
LILRIHRRIRQPPPTDGRQFPRAFLDADLEAFVFTSE